MRGKKYIYLIVREVKKKDEMILKQSANGLTNVKSK